MNNIEIINNYLKKESSDHLIVNKVTDEIGAFYLYSIKYLSSLLNINLELNDELNNQSENVDLFGLEKILLTNATSSKKIDQILSSQQKTIIFTDYKNFKKYQNNHSSVNGYNYLNDIKFFISNILKINNHELVEICSKTPQLIYSETSKYLINENGYLKDTSIMEEVNSILEVRKDIYNMKKINDLPKLFEKIKEEVRYKKFNFLTS